VWGIVRIAAGAVSAGANEYVRVPLSGELYESDGSTPLASGRVVYFNGLWSPYNSDDGGVESFDNVGIYIIDGSDYWVYLSGIVPGMSGLVDGVNYYTNGTEGQISYTKGTYSFGIGSAISSTEIFIHRSHPVYWGSVIGTLSEQTDLWAYLSSGGPVLMNCSQSSHGFSEGDAVYYSPAGNWELSDASSVETARCHAIVYQVLTAGTFVGLMPGPVPNAALYSSSLDTGNLYLDDTTPGGLTYLGNIDAFSSRAQVLIPVDGVSLYFSGYDLGDHESTNDSDTGTGSDTTVYVDLTVSSNAPFTVHFGAAGVPTGAPNTTKQAWHITGAASRNESGWTIHQSGLTWVFDSETIDGTTFHFTSTPQLLCGSGTTAVSGPAVYTEVSMISGSTVRVQIKFTGSAYWGYTSGESCTISANVSCPGRL
jgi:hypothetical protein